jgi:probable F420-dependent oxidoreductase
MRRYGMNFPLRTLRVHEQKDWVRELEDLGYSDLWSLEANALDGFTPLAAAAQWSDTLRLGCALFPVQTRGPALMAQSVAGMCEIAPGRFIMGIGSSSQFIVELWNGIQYEKPYQFTRDMALFLREVLSGRRITHDYECFSVKGFKLDRAPDAAPPIYLGGLRPGMIELAGKVGDGVILNWILPEDLPGILPHVHKHGGVKETTVRIFAAPGGDLESVRADARQWIASYLSVPTYRAQQEWLGRGPLLQPMWDAMARGDMKGAMAAIPDEIADGFYPGGDPARVSEHIERYFEAGVDTVIIGLLEESVDPRAAARLIAPK